MLGAVIGVLAGLGAAAFFALVDVGTTWLLGGLGGQASRAGAAFPLAGGFVRPWAVPLVVAAGALVASALVFSLAPEAEGHGTGAAIDAAHNDPKGMRARVTVVKMFTSAITLGSGGSGGTEGPTAQITATFGSLVARWCNLSVRDARIAVSAGLAAGVGAIFRAPLGGAILGAEVLYRSDIAAEVLIPALISSAVAYGVFGSIHGFAPVFGDQSVFLLDQPVQLLMFVLLGVVTGLLGRLYIWCFYGVKVWSSRWPMPRAVRPALAGLVVGTLGLAIPGVLGTGYGTVQAVMDPEVLLSMSLWLVLAAPLAKIAATSLSIGSGAPGGVFGPGIVTGAIAGAALWRLLEPTGLATASPVPFIIVGMAAVEGAAAHTPLALMVLVAEATGTMSMLAPTMLAVAVASVVVGDATLYRSQLRARTDTRIPEPEPERDTVTVQVGVTAARAAVDAAAPAQQARVAVGRRTLTDSPVVMDGVRGSDNGSGSFRRSAQRLFSRVAGEKEE